MKLHGPQIIARSLSVPAPMGAAKKPWQYHSRSDRHSKITCWAVLFDLLSLSGTLRKQVERQQVGFGINHQMVDFKADRRKDLDLVICTPGSDEGGNRRTMIDLALRWGVVLNDDEQALLDSMPPLAECPVGAVQIALEAKACMTEHSKARPRLYDELNSSHQTIHGASPSAIAAGFVMINAATIFQSPGKTSSTVHNQPKALKGVLEKVKQLPRRSGTGEAGYDSLAILVVDCVNDGCSPVSVIADEASGVGNFGYETALRRMAGLYDQRFPLP